MSVVLEAGPARVEIAPEDGGRIAALEVGDVSLLVPRGDDAMRWGSYPMAPWAGRVRDGRFDFEGRTFELPRNMPPHAIHGTTFTRAWTDEGGGRMSIDLGPDWPFAGRAVQRITLAPDHLEMRLEVHSDDVPFPASLGWHPWFRRDLGSGKPLDLAFEAASMYERDPFHLPSGRLVAPSPRPWDDCFTGVETPPLLCWDGVLTLAFSASTDHWVVYDEPAHAICVEPMTGPPNALNLAPRIVTPESPLVATARLAWTLAGA